MKVAVIGAGLSGLVIARELARHHDVTVFEKSRGVGGRMATRYAGEYRFDHGAQFFTARSRSFRQFLEPFIDAGVVANWRGTFAEYEGVSLVTQRPWNDSPPHYVAVPGMNALGQTLARDLNVRLLTAVSGVERLDDKWTLFDAEQAELGSFDWLIVTVPAAQAATLVGEQSALGRIASEKKMLGCYALMLGFEQPLSLPWQAALVRNNDISWISVNSSKPGRDAPFTLLVHSTNNWAEQHMEDDAGDVRNHLISVVSAVTGHDCSVAGHVDLHRWRYANTDRQQEPFCFMDANENIGACGDWFVRGRIEAAYRSARLLLDRFAELDLATGRD